MSSSTTSATTIKDNTTSNRLLLDPNISPTPFDSESLYAEALQAKKEDEIEIEAILTEFEELTHEFQIWTCARIRKENSLNESRIRIGSEEILEEELKQEAKRGSLAQFIDNFRNAFRLLSG